ncbi:MAG TPA: virulence factor [Nocardioidaceae bacterium]|nr:virulence factor [Nocardioidaceae bacterium]
MAEYQITYWRELPSLVVAREGDVIAKSPLPQRFQEAIDEAAMRLGDTDADAYLAGWRRTVWTVLDGTTADVAEQVAADLERQWPPEAVDAFLAGLADDRQDAS